jgi:phosphate acetyltransferase
MFLASSLATSNGIPLAGLVLTERTAPATQILDFCQHAIKRGLPILHTQLNTLETAQRLADFGNEIPVDDTERAEQVTRFESYRYRMAQTQVNGNLRPRLSLLLSS